MRRGSLAARCGLALAGVLLSACTAAAYDDDGELVPPGDLAAPAPKSPDAVDVVIDTDLAPDDLVAIAYLMRHPDVRVLALTVPGTGMVPCPGGVDIAHDLMAAVGVEKVPVSCGTTPRGPHGQPFPQEWSVNAATHSGLPRDTRISDAVSPATPVELIARLARQHPGLEVVALGPATELAALLEQDAAAYSRIARIVTMTGVHEGPAQDAQAGEWNAAADPDALAQVLAGPVPVTVVPHEVVPPGSPDGIRAPVVGGIGHDPVAPTPLFWDTSTAAYYTVPGAGRTTTGTWSVSLVDEPGRLTRLGDGDDAVVTELDAEALEAAYRQVFVAE